MCSTRDSKVWLENGHEPISGALGASTSDMIDRFTATFVIQLKNLVRNVVPEPSTLALAGAGVLALLGGVRNLRAGLPTHAPPRAR
jgi:hypothetical protein